MAYDSISLPYNHIKFVNNVTLAEVLRTADDSRYGYIIECTIGYHPSIHDKLRDFVPSPESIIPNIEWLSEYQKEVGEKRELLRMVNIKVLVS